jgi:hypothetical protein
MGTTVSESVSFLKKEGGKPILILSLLLPMPWEE